MKRGSKSSEEDAKGSQALAAWRQRAVKADLLLSSTMGRPAATSSSSQLVLDEPPEAMYPAGSRPDTAINMAPAAAAAAAAAAGAGSSGQGTPGEFCSPTRCGVSLSYLRQLVESLDASMARDMYSLVQKLISPIVRAEGKFCQFWDLIPRAAIGAPHYYVVHAWGASLRDVVAQVEFCLGIKPDNAGREAEVYVWVSAFGQSQTQKPLDVDMVKEVIKACSKGMVVVVDPGSLLLTRLWCCYEVWAASYYGEHAKIKMAFPEDISIDQMAEYEQSCQRLSLMQCDTTRAEDKTMLLSSIKGSVGLKIMTKTLSETLLRAARVSLRFSNSVKNQAMYCALLLKGGEYCRCQQVLCNLDSFGLDDDDRMLEEMKSIFRLYDEDGSGELGRDEFVSVLSNTGFEGEEADRIFDEINTDGSAGVSIEEWQEWWLSSRKTEEKEKPRRRRVVMLASGLVENLEKMVRLMQQNHLTTFAAFFKDYHKRLSDGSIMKPTQVLAASPLKGDWLMVLDQVMFSLHKKLYRQASQPLYDLLMWNSDSMDFNPSDLPSPQQLQGDAAMMQGLQMYLQLFASILAHQPGRGRHAEYLLKSATSLPVTPRDQDPRRRDQRAKQDKNDAARFTVVRNMISLKYGKDQPFCENLIAEAEMSLGQMMANKKGATNHRDGFAESLNSSYIKGSGSSHVVSLMSTSAGSQLTGRKDASDELIEQLSGAVADMSSKKAKEFAASETARKGLSLACQSFKRLASKRLPDSLAGDLSDASGEDGVPPLSEDAKQNGGGGGTHKPAGRARSQSLLLGAESGSPSFRFPGITGLNSPQSPSSDLLHEQMNSPRYALVCSEPLRSPRFAAASGRTGSPPLGLSLLSGDAAKSPRAGAGAASSFLSGLSASPPVAKTRLPSIRWNASQLPDADDAAADDEAPARPQKYTSIMRLPSLAETRDAGNVVEDLLAKVVRAPSFAYANSEFGMSPRGTAQGKTRRMSALDVMLSGVKDSPLMSRAQSKVRTPRGGPA